MTDGSSKITNAAREGRGARRALVAPASCRPNALLGPSPGPSAFSLLELLMVISIIAVLAALLMPALSKTRDHGRRVSCQSNLRELALCVQMYNADNDGKLPENRRGSESPNSWVRGNMAIRQDATNQMQIRRGKLFAYASSVGLFRCPSDASQTSGTQRVRSYSMNSWLGSRDMEKATSGQRGFRTFVSEGELSLVGPSRIWLMLEEHERSIDDAWFLVTMDDAQPFASFPSTRHDQAYDLNFCDGHVELYRLRDPASRNLGVPNAKMSANNADWTQLKNVTTVR